MVINKKEFIDRVEFEDKNLISNVYDKIMLCKKINNVVYTEEFYPPNVWNPIENLASHLPVNIYSSGVFEEAERRMLAFAPDEVWYYPIDYLR
jgi:RNA-binding protein YlmH